MNQAAATATQFSTMLAERLVRYRDLRPCTTAFIDTRTPGRQEKENFTIIGPGVAESPDQHVHINIPHGFNIGGARQPPDCINSQHSHKTAEVFIIHRGTWAFYLGPECEDGEVVLGPGDTISIPTDVFRGFKNVGDESGYMFAVLGGDIPGHVMWAPYVFESAAKYGLILLEDGSLVDTTKGESIPDGKRAMAATTAEDVASLRALNAEDMADCVFLHDELRMDAAAQLMPHDLLECPVIGEASSEEGIGAGKMTWSHGFQLRYMAVDPGAESLLHARKEEEVLLVQNGELTVEFAGGRVKLGAGDVFTIPIDMPHRFLNSDSEIAQIFVVRGGDKPEPPRLID
jgi:mannose-6-phosphate isomerase-like protein (cupin superfamily)